MSYVYPHVICSRMVLLFSIRVIFFFGQIGCSATGVSGKATEMPSEKMYKFRVRKWLCGGFCVYLTLKKKSFKETTPTSKDSF